MRIWLVTVGEPLPSDPGNPRLLRAGMLAHMLARRGHQVLWWSSTFDHPKKQHRFQHDTRLKIYPGLELFLLHSIAYPKNVCLRRIINHKGIARKFRAQSESEEKPDVILSSYPTMELCREANDYGLRHEVPVSVDIRDLWPDLFLELVPTWMRGLVRFIAHPMFVASRRSIRNSRSIVGVSPGFRDWGVALAGRPSTSLDRVFPLAYSESRPDPEALRKAEEFWAARGVGTGAPEFVVCLFAMMGVHLELEVVIDAACKLLSSGRRFKFVFCGVGERLEHYKQLAAGCPEEILFPGWVGTAEIWALMRRASVGLAPYLSSWNHGMNLPNKIIEYLSAGLPIVSCLKGETERLLRDENCGVTYPNGQSEALATELIDLHDHPDRLRTLSANAHRVFQDRFTAEKVYAEMADYVEQMARR